MEVREIDVSEKRAGQDGLPSILFVMLHRQSYSNLLYALWSFLAGVFYFIYVIVGMSLALGLIPLFLAGLPLFLGVVKGAGILVAYEANLASRILLQPVYYPPTVSLSGNGLVERLRQVLINLSTYKSLFFLLIKFPLGLFCIVLVALAAGGLFTLVVAIAGILLNIMFQVDIFSGNISILTLLGLRDGPLEQGLLGAGIGLVLSMGSMYIINLLTDIQAKLAMWAASNSPS